MPFLSFFVNGVRSSASSAPLGESFPPVAKKSPKLLTPPRIPPGTNEVMIGGKPECSSFSQQSLCCSVAREVHVREAGFLTL